MTPFGIIMAFIFLVWSFVSFRWFVMSGDIYVFLRGNFVIVVIGYILILVFYGYVRRWLNE